LATHSGQFAQDRKVRQPETDILTTELRRHRLFDWVSCS